MNEFLRAGLDIVGARIDLDGPASVVVGLVLHIGDRIVAVVHRESIDKFLGQTDSTVAAGLDRGLPHPPASSAALHHKDVLRRVQQNRGVVDVLQRSGVLILDKVVLLQVDDGLRRLGGQPPTVLVIFCVEEFLAVLVDDVIVDSGSVLAVEKRAGVEKKQPCLHRESRSLCRAADLVRASRLRKFGSGCVIFRAKPIHDRAPR